MTIIINNLVFNIIECLLGYLASIEIIDVSEGITSSANTVAAVPIDKAKNNVSAKNFFIIFPLAASIKYPNVTILYQKNCFCVGRTALLFHTGFFCYSDVYY